jgi:hypothetical protein
MHVVEEGVLAGVLTKYWQCFGSPAEQVDTCPQHGDAERARRRRAEWKAWDARFALDEMSVDPLPCRCRPARACSRTARTEDTSHAEPSLDLGGAV